MLEEFNKNKLEKNIELINNDVFSEFVKQTFYHRSNKFGKIFTDLYPHTSIDIGGGKILSVEIANIITKANLAKNFKKYESLGIDAVALTVNQLVAKGFEPINVSVNIILDKDDNYAVKEIMKGVVKASKEAEIVILKGKKNVESENVNNLHITSMAMGVTYKDSLIKNEKIKSGDFIIGAEDYGLDTKAFEYAKRILSKRYDIGTYIKELNATLWEELLNPHTIYVKPIMEIMEYSKINGLLYMDSGFSKLINLCKKANIGFEINLPKHIRPIFKLIQHHGILNDKEMFKNFNMGFGLLVFVPGSDPEYCERVKDVLKKYKINHEVIGSVVPSKKVVVNGVEIE
ncbi:MAG: AIR synthase related protein [Candidatus Aenigmatarchaeota archaeon]